MKKKTNKNIKTNELTDETKVSMKTRIVVAIFGTLSILPFLILGDWPFAFFALVLTLISCYEIIRCNNKKNPLTIYVVMGILSCLMAFWPIFRGLIQNTKEGNYSWHLYTYFEYPHISIIVLVASIIAVCLVTILHEYFTVRDACFLITMGIIICLGVQCILYVRYLPSLLRYTASGDQAPALPSFMSWFDNFSSSTLLLYVLIGVFGTDIGAYFFGLLFGKIKINPRISPKKTYAGFVGGIFTSLICSSAFAFLFAILHKINPSIPSLLNGYLDLNKWYHIIIISSMIPFCATLGDFVFSAIKRFFDVKDFGSIIIGHGGLLDRMDSIFFAYICVGIYLCFITNASNIGMLI